MSFNAKNLTYESKEPSFLRKLKGQYAENDNIRPAAAVSRPRKPKDDDADDDPVIVDESGQETITKAQYDEMREGGVESATRVTDTALDPEGVTTALATDEKEEAPKPSSKEATASIGGASKKRVAKTIGEEDVAEPEADAKSASLTKSAKKPTKKAKKVKLSFDDDDA